MILTTAQRTTLRNSITGNVDAPGSAQFYTDGNTEALAALYNVPSTFWVYKTSVSKAELTNTASVDATVFNWTGAGFITRSVGERDAWRELFDADGYVNPSLPQVRQAFTDIFSGATAPAPANRTHLSAVSRRLASKAERLFATGTGSTASPGTLVVEGALLPSDLAGL